MKTGGKQYRVQTGDVLRVEKLAAEAGETVQFNEVLMIGGDTPVVGAPLVEGAAVQAEVIDQIRGEKVIHFVKRRRKHGSQRTKGHRQYLTLVRVTEILAAGAEKSGVKAAVGAGSDTAAAAATTAGEAAAPKAAPRRSAAKADAASGDDVAKPATRKAATRAASTKE
jgi:large subunit ribosomal protein L21